MKTEEEEEKNKHGGDDYVPVAKDLLHIIPSTTLYDFLGPDFKDFSVLPCCCKEWNQQCKADVSYQLILEFFDRWSRRENIRMEGRYCCVCKCSRSSDCIVCNICGVTTEADNILIDKGGVSCLLEKEMREHFSLFANKAPGTKQLYLSSCKSFISLLNGTGRHVDYDNIENIYNGLSIDSCMFFDDYLLYDSRVRRKENMGGETQVLSEILDSLTLSLKLAVEKKNDGSNGLTEKELGHLYDCVGINIREANGMETYEWQWLGGVITGTAGRSWKKDRREVKDLLSKYKDKVIPYKTLVRIAFKIYGHADCIKDTGDIVWIPEWV